MAYLRFITLILNLKYDYLTDHNIKKRKKSTITLQDSSYMLTIYLLVHRIYKSAFIIVGFPTFASFHKYLVDNDNSTIIYLKKHAFFGSCSSK